MCKDCGCEEGNNRKYFNHSHKHEHEDHHHSHEHHHHGDDKDHRHHEHHHHGHDNEHDHHRDGGHVDKKHHNKSKTLILERNILAKNDEFAAKSKKYLKDKGILCINIISSPGSGKTTLLEKTLLALKGRVNCSVIVGDQSTDNDAKRLEGKCDFVHQIETHSSCHVNAEQILEVLDKVTNDKTKLLFIENVGNLICPAAFDLGEEFKIVLLSTTEGEDKPVKYPIIFSDSSVAVITKTDLIAHLDWDIKKCRNYIRQVNPGMFIFELSAKSGDGMDLWIDYLLKLVE